MTPEVIQGKKLKKITKKKSDVFARMNKTIYGAYVVYYL